MRVSKRILSMMMVLFLLVCLLPVGTSRVEAAISTATYQTRVNAFINDSRWKDGVAWGDNKKPQYSSYSSVGCCAYAADFAGYVYGNTKVAWNASTYTKFTNVNDIRTGDIIHTSNHWFVVLERNGSVLRTAEGNRVDKVYVRNNAYTITNGKLYTLITESGKPEERTFAYGFHYNFSDSNTPVVTPDLTPITSTAYQTKVSSFISDSRWKSGIAWADAQVPKYSAYSTVGDSAYAADFAAYVYGSTVTAWDADVFTEFTDLNEIRTGDIIHTDNHWFIVLERNGNTLRTAEGNFDDKTRICSDGWGIKNGAIHNLKASSSKRTFLYGFHYNFLKTYAISFDTNGGSGTFAAQTVAANAALQIPTAIPTREGYTFAGWNVLRTGDSTWYCAPGGWNTEASIDASGYTKKVYAPGTEYTMDTSWWSACEDTPGFTFYALWEKNAEEFGITASPEDVTATVGETAQFVTQVTGQPQFYQWQYSKDGGKSWYNSSAEGYSTDTLIVAATMARNGFRYRCKVTADSGEVLYSAAAQLTVQEPIFDISSHPADETVKLGNRASFTVATTGNVAAYQWQYQMVANGPWWNCTPYTMGYNTATLNVLAAEKREGFLYRCRVTDTAGNKYYSDPAELTVDIPESYAVLSQPQNAQVIPGKTTTFHVETQGEGLTYQWEYHKGVDKSGPEYYWIAMGSTTGCKTDTLTIAGISGSTNRDGWAYRCVITDSQGYVYTTDYAFLNVTAAQITSQPENTLAAEDSKAVFAVEAEGEVASYQWQYSKDGGKSWYNSSSATQGYNTDTLTVGATAARNGFMYRCVVIDADGNRHESRSVTLTVVTAFLSSQPDAVTACADSDATFCVAVEGKVQAYQWQYSKDGGKSWYNSSSATVGYNTDTLTVGATAARNGFLYRCKVTDADGNVLISEPAQLTVE